MKIIAKGIDEQSVHPEKKPPGAQHGIKSWLFLILLCMVVMNTGCVFSRWIPVLESTITGAGILYIDDFSDPASGWDTRSDDKSLVEYQDGQLRMVVQQPYYDFRTSPGLSFQDSRIQVTATRNGGPVDNFFGLVCRYQDEGNYYAFLASSDGYGGIARVREGDFEVLTGGRLQFDTRIEQSSLPNRMEAQCIGPRLSFLVNGERLYEAGDPELISGRVGLMAGSYQSPGVDVLFDDFIVLRP